MKVKGGLDLEAVDGQLQGQSAEQIVRWAGDVFGPRLILTSSFGTQAAVMLHLVTRVIPDIPVVLIDTGYLFPETYRFIDLLTKRLKLNLKIYQPVLSAGHFEAVHGKLWEQGEEGLTEYNRMRKVEPMQRALRELNAAAWLAGLRKQQTDHRAGLRVVELQDGIYKIHPILEWTGRDVHRYLQEHELPYHPLFDQGYKSIGDTHSTAPVGQGVHERSGRFGGLKQECGLHLPTSVEENESRESSSL